MILYITDKGIPLYAYDTNLLNVLFMIIIRIVPLVIIQSIFALEDFSEGWMFPLAAFGFYYLFWLSVLIKNFIVNDN